MYKQFSTVYTFYSCSIKFPHFLSRKKGNFFKCNSSKDLLLFSTTFAFIFSHGCTTWHWCYLSHDVQKTSNSRSKHKLPRNIWIKNLLPNSFLLLLEDQLFSLLWHLVCQARRPVGQRKGMNSCKKVIVIQQMRPLLFIGLNSSSKK